MTTTTTETLTNDMLVDLAREAGAAGDMDTLRDCIAAQKGDQAARGRCAAVITDARGMDDEGDFVRVTA